MMTDFETNLTSQLAEMEKQINSMVEGMMSELETNLAATMKEVEALSTSLPDSFVTSIDGKMDNFFTVLD
jgi:hypothetical protein